MTDARDEIIMLQHRINWTRTDRDHHRTGTWPPHVDLSLSALHVALPPRPPATLAQIDAYDTLIASCERRMTELLATHQTPPSRSKP